MAKDSENSLRICTISLHAYGHAVAKSKLRLSSMLRRFYFSVVSKLSFCTAAGQKVTQRSIFKRCSADLNSKSFCQSVCLSVLSVSLSLYIYIYIYMVFSISFQTFLHRHLKLSVDSCNFNMLLLYIIWEDWLIFMISGSNEQQQHDWEYTLLNPDCHSWWISKMQSGL